MADHDLVQRVEKLEQTVDSPRSPGTHDQAEVRWAISKRRLCNCAPKCAMIFCKVMETNMAGDEERFSA
jgi:hypothetical protein